MERSMPKHPTDVSLLATVREFVPSGQLLDVLSDTLLVAGELDDGRWGSIGAFWRPIDGASGGFLVSPDAIWAGSEMVQRPQRRRADGSSNGSTRTGSMSASPGDDLSTRNSTPTRCSRSHAASARPDLAGPALLPLPGDEHVARLRPLGRADEPLAPPSGPSAARRGRSRP